MSTALLGGVDDYVIVLPDDGANPAAAAKQFTSEPLEKTGDRRQLRHRGRVIHKLIFRIRRAFFFHALGSRCDGDLIFLNLSFGIV